MIDVIGITILFVVLVMILGWVMERVVQRHTLRKHPAHGQLISVGEHELHLHVSGKANGKPTIILEAGNGGFSAQWVRVQNKLSPEMQVVSYDRAGYGWSEPAPYPVDLASNAYDLQTALDKVGVKAPYILVGHSMGGLFNLSYASKYPENVAGMVFVDSTHPEMWQHFPKEVVQQQKRMMSLMRIMYVAVNFGIMRLFNPLASVVVDLPTPAQKTSLRLSANPRYIKRFLQEAQIVSNLPHSMPPIGNLNSIPISVLSANSAPEGQTMSDEIFKTMHGLHQQLAASSNEGQWRLLDGANHYSIIMSETYVMELVQAVRDLARVKSSITTKKDKHPRLGACQREDEKACY